MPRPNLGPKLVLFGPNKRRGAKPRRDFRSYVYYVVWREDGRRVERSTGTDDLRKAQEELSRVLTELKDRDAAVAAPAILGVEATVADCLAIYLENHGDAVRDKLRLAIGSERLLRFWADILVREIQPLHARRYAVHRRDAFAADQAKRLGKKGGWAPAKPLSDDTIRRELGILRAALNHCKAEGHIAHVPAIPLPRPGTPRTRFLSRQEIARLIRAARVQGRTRHYLPLFILLAFYTGARKTAILQLQWAPNAQGGHVDLGKGIIDLQGGAPRTKKRRAVIPIPPRLRPFLEAARRRTCTHVVECDGRPLQEVKHSLETAGEAAGLGKVHAHVLKHSAVTNLLSSGVPVWQVAGWTATSTDTLQRVYGHHIPENFQDVLGAFMRARATSKRGTRVPEPA